jgi:ribosomal protein S18 acetylase RimI-like enzyme
MAITYFKRFRMEISLEGFDPIPLQVPFFWKPWDETLIEAHAEVKYHCFREEIDAQVFPCLGNLDGCLRLMREIRRKPGFLPEATWLIACPDGYCATIQGVVDRGGLGAIQNVGVVPSYRGIGLGRALVGRALLGFRAAGLSRVYLEVTAENSGAVRLYRSLGFRRIKTLYKAVDG